ncbi:MAG: dihydroorotase [Planctomycetes bacterium]|nr:dihydroorotase [Planctomycetota bacterium]
MAEQLLIHGGRVIDPASGLDATGDVLIVDGAIETVSTKPGAVTPGPDATRIDAEGCIVAPGLIDVHVHFREPGDVHEETIATGSAAAVAGGFTTVCCMPNTTPPLDGPEMIELVAQRGAEAGGAHVLAVGCATVGRAGETVADIAAMARAGAAAFSDDGDCVASAGVMDEVLRAVRAVDGCFMQHCQEPTLTRGAVMNAGPLAERLGVTGWPAVAEELIIERDARINRSIGARYHAQHVSSGESAAIIRRARAEGQPVSGEVSPHHLLLTEDAITEYGTAAKMNPPLRTARDVTLLKEAVADGTITVLATDHAPHPAASKALDLDRASFGIVGVECALALYARALIDDGVVGWPELLAMMTIHPADLLGPAGVGRGRLQAGAPGDVTVIDPRLEWTIDAAQFVSAGRNCPFDGCSVRGRAVATVVSGQARLLHPAHG